MIGNDLIILEASGKSGITQIITDDGDYCTVPAITVFTGNHTVITAATSQGKLLRR